MTERTFDKQSNKIQSLGWLMRMAIGLPFMANPQVLLGFIEDRFKGCVGDLFENGSEKKEVLRIIERLPEGTERTVAGMINYAMNRRPPKCKKRTLNSLLDKKPHRTAVEVLRQAGDVYSRGNSLEDR